MFKGINYAKATAHKTHRQSATPQGNKQLQQHVAQLLQGDSQDKYAKRFTRKKNIHIKSLRMKNKEGNSRLNKDPVRMCQIQNTTCIQRQTYQTHRKSKTYMILTPTHIETKIRNTHKSPALQRDRVHLHVESR